jgi:hypothetical protein
MRYFLKDFHKADNSGDLGSDLLRLQTDFGFSRAKQKRLDKKFRANYRAYLDDLASIKDRVPANARRFFFPTPGFDGLHDCTLLAFEAGDALGAPIDGSLFNPRRYKSAVRLRFLNDERTALYTFKYSGVTRATFDFPSRDPLHLGSHIGEQLAHELLALDENTLRHEQYFVSGAEIVIDFESLQVKVKPMKHS